MCYKPRQRLSIEEEVLRDIQRLREHRKLAEEIVRDYGWSEKDDDFEIQIEEEAKRLWEEDLERDMRMWELCEGEGQQ